MSCKASDIIKIAINELGYHEKASNKNLDDKTANSGSNNWTKYTRDLDKFGIYNVNKAVTISKDSNNNPVSAAWCDCFVDWCMIKACKDNVNEALRLLCQPEKSYGAGCTFSYRYYKQNKQTSKAPSLGAKIFFGTVENNLKHTGIVVAYDTKYVYTIEGNTSNVVARRTYARNNSNIFGYGIPKYDAETDKIIGPMTFSGYTSPVAISIDINTNPRSSLNKTVKSIGKVNSASLNVRTWAGAGNPTLKSIPSISKNTTVGICDALLAPNGDKWYYIIINNKTYGFVNAKYITIDGNSISKVDEFSVSNTR